MDKYGRKTRCEYQEDYDCDGYSKKREDLNGNPVLCDYHYRQFKSGRFSSKWQLKK